MYSYMKILITPRSFSQSGEKAFEILKEYGCEVIINDTGKTLDEEHLIEKCGDIDGIIVGIDPITEKVLRSAKNLKAISKYGAGLDNIDLKTAEEMGIKVDRAAGTNATSVAELAVGLFFTLGRSITAVSDSTKAGGWGRWRGVELTGKTVGIVGLGNIGKEVARMVSGLGIEIVAYDPFINLDDEAIRRYSIKVDKLEEVIKNADFLTLHLPLTEQTKHMINKTSLSTMKANAYIVNTSRGELVDEDALYEALVNKVIAGAAEDVFSKEPPEGHKLLSLDNFVLTSHIGAFTAEANEKIAMKSTLILIEMLKK